MSNVPMLTPDELHKVKLAIILPIMLDALERDANAIAGMKLKLDILYITSLRKAQDRIHGEMYALRTELRQLGIKIIEETRAAEGVKAHYKCRGYDHKLLLLWDRVRTEILLKGSEYMGIAIADEGSRTS
jgi:hypothetical protein